MSLKNTFKKIWSKYIQDQDDNTNLAIGEPPLENDMFIGFWTSALSKFNDINLNEFNIIRIKDELLQELTFYTAQSYSILELDFIDFTKTHKLPDTGSEPILRDNVTSRVTTQVEEVIPPTIQPQPSSHVITSQPTENEATETLPEHITHSTDDKITLSEEEKEQHIDNHIIEPVSTTAKVQKVNQEIDRQLGGDPIDFTDASLKAIPVQAGGGLAEITDIWYIPKQIDSIEELRNELYQLIYDVACYGNYQDNLIQTTEGLGFGIIKQSVKSKNQHTKSIAFLIITLLRLHETIPSDAQSDISLGVIHQLLIGGHDITIGGNTPKSVGVERLPDVLLVKLFRFIRLARRLVDLTHINSK